MVQDLEEEKEALEKQLKELQDQSMASDDVIALKTKLKESD